MVEFSTTSNEIQKVEFHEDCYSLRHWHPTGCWRELQQQQELISVNLRKLAAELQQQQQIFNVFLKG